MRINLLLRAAIPALAALGISAPSAAEVTRATEDGFVSRHEVVVKANPKAVWLALITPATWWRSDHTWSGDAKNLTLTPQAGGCFCETIPEVDEPGRFTLQGSVEHMRVIQSYPEQALRMQGALGPLQSEPVVGILTIAISKVDAGTRIVWEYNVGGPMRYEVPVIAKAVDAVMALQLAALSTPLGPVTVSKSVSAPDGEGAAVAGPGSPAGTTLRPAPVPMPAPVPIPAPVPMPAPVLKVAPKPVVMPAAKPASQPAPTPAPAPTPKLPSKPASSLAPKPTPAPTPKPTAVDDAFGDLAETPQP